MANHKKMKYLWRLFQYRNETLSTVVTVIAKFLDMSNAAFPWQQNRLQALLVQKIKSDKNLQEVLFAFVVHSVGVSDYWHHMAQAQESPFDSGTTFSLCKGRGLVKNMLLWWHHNNYHNLWFLQYINPAKFDPIDWLFAQIFHILLSYYILCPHCDGTSHLICIN